MRGILRWSAVGVAVFAMVQGNPQKDALYSRLRSIESELSDASRAISGAQSEVSSLDASFGGLSGRLASVRGQGYAAMAHLDKTIELLTKKWADLGPSIKQSIASNLQPMSAQVGALQSESQTLRMMIDTGDIGGSEMLAGRLSSDATTLKSRVNGQAMQLLAPVKELTAGVAAIDRDLKIAETTVGLFGQASFPLKQGESPVLAIEGKLMEGEKCHGTLYFTNQRFVFEGLKEVVLEKHLFVATKKRTDRTLLFDHPVGAVQDITKGRVGLIAGTGVYVHFRPEINLPVTPFDVKGWEADVITRFFRYVTGGEAERDIAAAKGVTAPSAPTIRLVRCPACGAPHSGEIYQGQTSVKCEYCGNEVAIT
jgi:hypothetical protein